MGAWQSFGFQSEYISFLINYFVHRARASGFIFWCALALFERSVILSSSLINNIHSHFFWYKIILAPLSHLYQPRLSLSFFSSSQMKLQPAGTQIHLYSDAITAPFPIVLGWLEKWFLILKFIAWNYIQPYCAARVDSQKNATGERVPVRFVWINSSSRLFRKWPIIYANYSCWFT